MGKIAAMKRLLLLLLPFYLSAQLIDGVAILVKNEPITLYEIQEAKKEMHLEQKKVIDALIRKKLEALEVKERGISASSAEIYADIEKMAQQNHMSVLQLYDAMQSARGLSEKAFKKKIKERIISQKLYNAIAFSQLSEPTEAEQREYYALHKDKFSHPQAFEVLVYNSKNRQALEKKIASPMYYSIEINSQEATLEYAKINPRLAEILEQTQPNSFTPILPSPDGGFMSFYIKTKKEAATQPFEQVQSMVQNAIMADKREQVLKEYFARLRLNADIKILRLP